MKLALSLAIIFAAQIVRAQEKLLFLNEDGKPVKEKKAVILQQQLRVNDTCWEFNTYQVLGPRIISIQFSDEKGITPNGRYLVYNPKGYCDTVGYYNHGLRDRDWRVLTSAGRTLRQLTYNNGKLTGKKDSTQLNEERKKWMDSAFGGRTIVEVESAFPGGLAGWMNYLNHHLKYPDRAVNNRIDGKPLVTFIVSKTGQIEKDNIYLERSVEYSLDQTSLQVIYESPDWTPAVQDGKPVRSYKKQPVVFMFERK